MISFYNLSLRSKLILIIMVVTGFTILVGFGVNEAIEQNRLKQNLVIQSMMHARLVSEYCVTPLDFGYREEAAIILSKLASVPDIQNGILFDQQHNIFATFDREKKAIERPLIASDSATYYYQDQHLHISRPIIFNDELKGTIYLRVSTSRLSEQNISRIISSLILGLAMLIVSYLLGNRFQRIISQPILTLANIIHRITDSGDYTVKIEKTGNDEISTLYDGFAGLLEQIHLREGERDIAEEDKTRLNTILENTSDLASMSSPTGEIIYMNPAGRKMLGWHSGSIPENSVIADVHPTWASKIISAEGIPRAIKDGVWEGETAIIHEDGREAPVLQVIMAHKSPEGEVLYLSTIMHDITERKRTEKQVEKSSALLKAIFDAIPDGIISTALDHTILSTNTGLLNIFGMEEQDVLGQSVAFFVENQDEFLMIQKQRSLISEEDQLKPYIINYLKSDGTTFPGETLSVPIYTNSREQLGIIKLIRDVSDRVRFETNLRQSQKLEAVGTMVGGISHELNNILQSMFLYGGILQDDLPDDPEMREILQHLLDDGERARDIVKQILTFSRESVADLAPQFIDNLIEEALSFQTASLPPSILLKKNIDKIDQMVLCDKTQIHQIIINLCNNARDAMSKKGGILTVILEQIASPDQNHIELSVSDTGPGISEEIQERIFDPFFTTKDIGSGTGLGLSVVHGIVEAMNGSISVSSEIGVGSNFKLRFPVAPEAQKEEVSPDLKPQLMTSRNVLIVDDEEPIRTVTQRNLERRGYNVSIAKNGLEAFQLFNDPSQQFDLVITDQSMPEMSGIELTRGIRATGSNIPILMSTGMLGFESEQEYRDAGATGFIQKPWTNQELEDMIQGLLFP